MCLRFNKKKLTRRGRRLADSAAQAADSLFGNGMKNQTLVVMLSFVRFFFGSVDGAVGMLGGRVEGVQPQRLVGVDDDVVACSSRDDDG